jgi:hypothetical protein
MGDIDLPAFKATFDAASKYSEWSTIAVTIGVFIEFVALFIFSKDMPPAEKRVMVFATMLIVAGCGGEYMFGGRASDAVAQMQAIEQSDIATAQQKASEATAEAAKLGVTVDNLTQIAEQKAAQANIAIAALSDAAAKASAKADVVDKRTAPRPNRTPRCGHFRNLISAIILLQPDS